jgi:hypothetical protein
MNRAIENLLGKQTFCFNKRGLLENNAMLILIIFFVTSLTLLQLAGSQPADENSIWDKPFSSPQYLLHATGHGTMDGPRSDDWWFLHSNQPKNGFIELPDGMGGTFTYSIDQALGSFNTPREVCAAASGKTKDSSLGEFNCKDMAAKPEKPNTSTNAAQYCPAECKARNAIWNGKDEYPYCNCVCEKGYEFDSNGLNCVPITSESGTSGESSGQIEVVTMQGTTSAKPGDKTEVTLPSGGQAEIRAKCDNFAAKLDLIRLAYSDFYYLDVGVQFHVLSLQVAMKNLGCSELLRENYLEKVADFDGVPTSSSTRSPVEMKIELQQGPLRIEVVNDQVSLDVNTPTTTVRSEGRNSFGVAYDPDSDTSFVTAYQNSLLVQPANQAPFTLGSGQQVEVSSNGIGPITTIGQTTGGSTYVSPEGNDIYGPVAGEQGGCHTDPATGQTICVDKFDDFSNTVQSKPSISVPNSLQECETYTSEICGTWTVQGSQINAVWDNGAEATLNVEQFDKNTVVITRQDIAGSSAGLTARYEGVLTGNHVEGSVTWNWNGATWSGTWTADW